MRRNSLLQDNPSPFSPFEMEEVLSEATESEDESSSTQDWPPLNFTLWSLDSDSDSEELEAVPAVMESEAGRLLAARIPSELFDNILFYVQADRESQSSYVPLTRNRGEPSTEDILADLKRCSLVCLFWANKCREYMFSDRGLSIQSYEDAEIFRRYFVGGCPRLTPVHQLIGYLDITQSYSGILAPQDSERQTSFLHLLYLPAIQEKLEWLSIEGPVPNGFNAAKLDTPHWGIPPCTIVVPSSFLQNTKIHLKDVHLPSFYHVAKYIKHFSRAMEIEFVRVTWDGQMAPSLPHAPSTIFCKRRPRSLTINAWGGCTDSVHLALTAVMLNPNCPLHRLSDEEGVWMFEVMTLLWGHEKDPDLVIGFDVSEQTTTMYLDDFYFVFEETSASTDRSASALSVVGMHAYIHEDNKLPANFDALVDHARTHPTIRALVLLFYSLDRFQNSMKPFVEALDPATEAIEFVCAYEEEKDEEEKDEEEKDEEEKDEEEKGGKKRRELTGRVLGVDMFTLEPTGRIWAEIPNRWGSHKSLEILRRELKRH